MISLIQTAGPSKRMTIFQERDPTLSDTDNDRENPGKQGAKQTKPERAAADKQCKHGVAVYGVRPRQPHLRLSVWSPSNARP